MRGSGFPALFCPGDYHYPNTSEVEGRAPAASVCDRHPCHAPCCSGCAHVACCVLTFLILGDNNKTSCFLKSYP
eukprot:scaffold3594_cov133-Isochrysis_galbana.AAC.9